MPAPDRVMEKRLREFVDRDNEMRRFRAILDDPPDNPKEPPIMIVSGESGMGKTSLLARMIHECSLRELRTARVVWKDSNPPDYLEIMRRLRDDLGAINFQGFTDLVNYFMQEGYQPQLQINLLLPGAGTIHVAEGMQVSQARVGDVAGVIIKDSMIVVPRGDMAVPPEERRARLTRRFLENLKGVLAEASPVVVFLDALEKMSLDTERWLWEQLLDAVRSGELPQIRFVLCGQKPPPEDRDWRDFYEATVLRPLPQTDVVLYLKKRFPDLSDAEHHSVADLVYGMSQGNPAKVADMADAFGKMREQRLSA